jgi:hypothetical protein
MKLAMVGVFCATAMTAGIPHGITGNWSGSFHGQPMGVKSDGTYSETTTRFRLVLTLRGGEIDGILTVLSNPKITSPLSSAQCDSAGCGFEVIDNAEGEVFTWRVELRGTILIGSRNCGHMTPWGTGVCSRLFSLRARKASRVGRPVTRARSRTYLGTTIACASQPESPYRERRPRFSVRDWGSPRRQVRTECSIRRSKKMKEPKVDEAA